MGGKKIVVICGNIVAEMEGGKNCGNGIAKMGGKKKELWQWSCQKLERKERERERERIVRIKIYIYLEESITSPLPPDSYSPSTSKYIL